ncbi:hypothetical protein EV421DRAFT_1424565 [Armillaria borealis]|uniref:AAA-ATPase-like domain-containing protein n=1 Tax=Armillaria borealis TaxID=47425 RepID=A0AA39JV49_9AGAR|nr:hypothetical protein EV421DRAFT_1424565 [Armillaria borealis]
MHPVTSIKPWQSLKRNFWQNSYLKRWNSSSSGLYPRTKTSVKESTKFPVIRTNLLDMQQKKFHIFDKTRYIVDLEEDASLQSVLLCRPPHFGKSTVIDMLRRYHGSVYEKTLQETFQGLYVSDRNIQKIVPPSRWLVLDFNFSHIGGHDDDAVQCFYSAILDGLENFWELHQTQLELPPCPFIGETPGPWSNVNAAFNVTFDLVWSYLHENGKNSFEGVYVLVDDYDGAPNQFLLRHAYNDVAWNSTPLATAMENFWGLLEQKFAEDIIGRTFITGVTPVTLDPMFAKNISFNPVFSGLCGLTKEEVMDVMDSLGVDSNTWIKPLTKYTNGYHFSQAVQVEPVFNTRTCLTALRKICQNDLVASEEVFRYPAYLVPEGLLEIVASNSDVIHQLAKAVEIQDHSFTPIEYEDNNFYFHNVRLSDLNHGYNHTILKFLVYYGVLSFDPHEPTKFLRIPNHDVATQVVSSSMEWGGLYATELTHALRELDDPMNVARVLDMYRGMLVTDEFKDGHHHDEKEHADVLFSILFNNMLSRTEHEYTVTKIEDDNVSWLGFELLSISFTHPLILHRTMMIASPRSQEHYLST